MQRLKEILFDWKHISGYRSRNIILEAKEYVLTEYHIKAFPSLRNRSILLISDTHFRDLSFPYSSLADSINNISPDWIIFGGDIVHYMSYIKHAIGFFSALKAKRAKLAVLGNWDIQKLQWNSNSFWKEIFTKTGFELLSNSYKNYSEIFFAGITPYTKPNPEPYAELKNKFLPTLKEKIESNTKENKYTCLISHSPSTFIQNFSANDIYPNIVLSGHTHGGQIRAPLFGALYTSTVYWKLFEYGQYKNKINSTDMIISNGIGCTGPKFRFRCKPEAVKINFI